MSFPYRTGILSLLMHLAAHGPQSRAQLREAGFGTLLAGTLDRLLKRGRVKARDEMNPDARSNRERVRLYYVESAA